MTPEFDKSTFQRRIRIDASLEKVFNAWTTSEGLASWFLRDATYFTSTGEKRTADGQAQKGDRFMWKWHGWNHEFEGEVLDVIQEKTFHFTFGGAGVVEVSFGTVDGMTEVILIQRDIPLDEESFRNYYIGCNLGWSFWMVNLKAWLEHGIVLNERNMDFNELPVFDVVNG